MTDENINQPECELKENEIRLSDGRIVELRELTGLDEMLIDQIASKDKNATNPIAYGMLTQRISTYYSIASIDGKTVERPGSVKEVYAMATQFKAKDTAIINKKYMELNVGEDLTAGSTT